MGLKIDSLLFILGGFARLADVATDAWYISTQKYTSEGLYIASICFVCAPTTFLLLFITLTIGYDYFKGRREYLKVRILLGLGMAFGEQIGITLFFFGIYFYAEKAPREQRDLVDFLSKMAGLMEAFLKTIPLVIIQVYNSGTIGRWNYILIVSIGCSIIGLVYTCAMVLYMYDKITGKDIPEQEIENNVTVSENSTFDNKVHPKSAWVITEEDLVAYNNI
ncbi:unnamed protein product [Blepharisma stoltei]|uniref:Uncharacterized protein n=1 Tax=Blepharisma stoltei TaxID=1481888 RepID=A0AAU9IH72_9CILI|nr:unnamed protein product [Blepharisma stoltei]